MAIVNPRPASERFWDKVEKRTSDCWEWMAATNAHGYGVIGIGLKRDGDRRNVLAHRFSYEELIGPIPEGLELDHLCRNHACVNPAHLELVAHAENCRRGIAPRQNSERLRARTHCLRGHPLSGSNLYLPRDGKRYCRECRRLYKEENRHVG